MKERSVLCLLVLCAVGLAGCASEQKITSSQPGPPVWVVQVPGDTADHKVFVGMGLADNILDERTGRNRAMEDVSYQIAASLKTEVVKEAIDIVKTRGAKHLNQDVADASYYSQIETTVKQALSGVKQEAYYWEKWKVKRSFFRRAFTRYKYYVKASMSKADYQRLQTKLVKLIADSL